MDLTQLTTWRKYGQYCFQAFGLCLGQLSTFMQCLWCSVAFAAVLWLLRPWDCPCPAVYLSACVVLLCASVVFTFLQHGVVVLENSCSLHPTQPQLQGYVYLFVSFIDSFIYLHSSTEPIGSSVMGGHVAWCWGLVAGLLVGQASQVFQYLGVQLVLQPPRPLGHLTSICDLVH